MGEIADCGEFCAMSRLATLPRGHGQKIGRLQESAIQALLTHTELRAAAKAIGIRHETLSRWMHLESFREAYAQARRAALDQTIDLLRIASREAVETLQRNLQCGDPMIENAAAKVILETLLKQDDSTLPNKAAAPIQIQVVYAPATQVNIGGD